MQVGTLRGPHIMQHEGVEGPLLNWKQQQQRNVITLSCSNDHSESFLIFVHVRF